MGVRRFEDLDVWKRALTLSEELRPVLARADAARDQAMRDQLGRALLSTLTNIAEGFSRNRPREFAQFARVAMGSNGEARGLLYVAANRGYLVEPQFTARLADTDAVGQMLRRLVEALERHAAAGSPRERRGTR